MKDIRARILSNEHIAGRYYKMTLDAPYIAKTAGPGQFVEVKCSDSTEPLLRRPFSIHRVQGAGCRVQGIEILYEVIGKATEILAKKKAGDFVDVLGPLGSGFTLPPSTFHLPPSTFLIAGGIGAAPLVFLAEKLMEKKIKTVALIGARTKNLILCEQGFKEIGAEVHIATGDGTSGLKGIVTDLFRKVLRTTSHEPRTAIYACGPNPMLKSIADICRKRRLKCEVSLEERMACGFGVCLGCVVKVKGSAFIYKLACKDGPVFDASELLW